MKEDKFFNKPLFIKLFFKRLLLIADDKWINQKKWAELSKEDSSNISAWINGRKPVWEEKAIYLAKSLNLSDSEVDKIILDARKQELELSTGQKVGDIDESKAVEVLLSKNGIKLSDDAKAELERNIEFMRFKYPE